MASPIELVKRHPLPFGAMLVALLVFIYVAKRKAASGATTTVGAVTYPGTSDSVQQAQVQAGSAYQLARMQQASEVNAQNFQLALTAQKEAADFQTAQLTAYTSTAQQVNAITAATNLATLAAGTQNLSIQTQAQVSLAQTAAQLEAQEANDSLALDQAKISAATAVSTAQIGARRDVSIASLAASTQKSITDSNNTALVDLGAIAANTQTTVAGYGRDVALKSIQSTEDLTKLQMNNVAKVDQKVLDLIASGQLNKGGAGGANQIAALAAATGQPAIAFPAYGTATASLSGGNSVAGIISSLGSAVKAGASAIFS